MARRSRPHDAAVAVGVPVAFAVIATVLGLAVPPTAAGSEALTGSGTAPAVVAAPAGPDDQEPGDSGAIPVPNQSHADEGIGAAIDSSRRPITGSEVTVVNRVAVKKPVYFITIDDGTWKTPSAMRVVREHRVPVTVFLTNSAIGDEADYFRRITRFGGSVQNHTFNHEWLNSSRTDLQKAVCSIQDRYERLFGTKPWMLRPPGGMGFDRAELHDVAASCGIDRIVMWDVVATDTSVQYVAPPLKRGDIVLLHFTKGLGSALERVLALGRRQGLRPAPLEDYLREPIVG